MQNPDPSVYPAILIASAAIVWQHDHGRSYTTHGPHGLCSVWVNGGRLQQATHKQLIAVLPLFELLPRQLAIPYSPGSLQLSNIDMSSCSILQSLQHPQH